VLRRIFSIQKLKNSPAKSFISFVRNYIHMQYEPRVSKRLALAAIVFEEVLGGRDRAARTTANS
jgi:hypothetical protein